MLFPQSAKNVVISILTSLNGIEKNDDCKSTILKTSVPYAVTYDNISVICFECNLSGIRCSFTVLKSFTNLYSPGRFFGTTNIGLCL